MAYTDLSYTEHGLQRKSQRCKREGVIETLLANFDQDVYVRRGVWAWSVSRAYLEGLVDDGRLARAEAERLVGLVMLIAEDTGEVVSMIRGRGRRIGRYYKH